MRLHLLKSQAWSGLRSGTGHVVCVLSILFAVPLSRAATQVWENTGTTFSTGGNWVSGTAPANNINDDIASFQAATPANQPNFTANRSINGIEFTSGTGAWTFTGSGGTRTLTLGSGGIVSNSSSTQTFNNANLAITLGANTSFTSNSTGALNFGSSLASFNLGSFTLTLGGSSTNASNQIAEPIAGTGGIIKSGTGTWALSGANSYTGTTTINGGTLSVNTMANGGSSSAIGASSNSAANLVINGGTLQYTGSGHSSNRLFTIGTSGGTIAASGTGALNLTNTGSIALSGTNTARTLTLTGTNTNNNTLTAVIGNNGTGATSLVKDGTGLWILSGNNTYTGTTSINAGTLRLGAANRLSDSTDVTVASGATFSLNNFAETVGTIAGAGSITLGSATLSTAGNGSTAFTGVISGTGGLTKGGTGTLTLSGTNTYTGVTTINGGTLSINTMANGGSNSAIGASSNGAANLVINGGTLQYTGSGHSSNRQFTLGTSGGTIDASGTGALNLSNSGGVTLSGSNTARTLTLTGSNTGSNTLAAVIGNNGTGATTLVKSGTGTWVLSGNNSYTGKTIINEGVLAISSEANLGANPGSSVADQLTLNGGTLRTQTSAVTIDDTNRKIFLGSNGGTFDTVTNLTVASTNVISGSGTLTKTGSGTLYLQAANTHTGNIVVNAGTLRTTGGSSIGDAATVTINGGSSIWQIDANETIGNLAGNGQVVFSANRTLTLGTSGDSAYSGVISDGSFNGNLVKTGTGTLTLSGASSYSGTTTISQGTLQLNANAPSGANGTLGNATSAVTLNNAGTGANNTALLIGASGVSVNRNITIANQGSGTATLGGNITSGTGSFTGNVTLNRSVNLNADGTSTIEFSTGTISGGGGITKTGTGTVLLNTANSSTGTTTINAGTLAVDGQQSNNRLASNANVVINNGGTFEMRGVNATSASAPANITVNAGGTLHIVSGASTYGGTDSHAHLGTLTLAGGTLNLSYSGSGTAYSNESVQLDGAVNVTADSVIQFGAGANNTNAGVALNGNTLFTVNAGATLSVNAELENRDSGNNGFTKAGAGTMVLSGTNTYTGKTIINQGVLAISSETNLGANPASFTADQLTLNGGTLRTQTSAVTIDDTNRGITLGASGGTFDTVTDLTIAATNPVAGSGGLTKTGAGTLTLAGNNTYAGATTVGSGTLLAASNNALGSAAANATVNSGATLALAGGVNITRSGTLTLNGNGTAADTGALHAAGGAGTTSQWTGSITVNTASTVTAADNLLIIGNGATGMFNTTTLTLNDAVTFHTPGTATVVPTYLPAPSYVLDPANIVINSRIVGTGDLIKTGDGTLSIIRGTSTPNTFSGNTYVRGGKLIVEGPSNQAHLSSPDIFVGNLGSANNDTVILQAGQSTGAAPGNNMIGVYNPVTNASTSNLTIYEDGLFNMNRSSNGFVNLTLHGGHVDGVGLNPLLTISGDLLSKSSAQTGLIENLNLGIGSNNLTLDVEDGTTPSDIDLIISARIQQGVGFTAVATGTSLEKTGEGTVVFSGANTYGGITQVSNGVLNIQNATALGQNSGTLGSTNHGTVVTGDGQLQIQGGLTVDNETITLSGTGHGGTGALRSISGDNTLNGFVYLSGNARIETDAGSLLTIANPGGVNNSILDGLSANRALTVGGAGDTTINGAIGSNIGAITKQDTGTLTLAGNNSYTGATTVSAGALKITHNNGLSGTGVGVAAGAALQFAQNASNQNITAVGVAATIRGTGIGNGGAIQNLNGHNTYLGNVTLANHARIAADSGSSLTLSGNVGGAGYTLNTGGAGNTTYNGVISGSGTAINKTDSGTVTFGGTSANTYTGTTTIADGTLALNKTAGVTAIASTTVNIGDGAGAPGSATLLLSQSNQINDNAALNLASDGRLNLNGKNETVGSIAGDGSIVFGTGQLTIGGNNSNSTFSGTLAGDSAAILNKNGSGTLTINSSVNAAPGDFAGTVNLNAGTVAFNADNAFTGTFNVYAGTTLKLTDVDLSIANLNFLGTGSITLDFSGASTLNVTNLSLAAGVTVNVINWANAVDYFFAQNWIGATQDLTGTTPMNQIVFAGGSPAWTGNNTIWQSYDDQITPVPEPSTYGAMLIGAIGALLGYRRWRRQNTKPKA